MTILRPFLWWPAETLKLKVFFHLASHPYIFGSLFIKSRLSTKRGNINQPCQSQVSSGDTKDDWRFSPINLLFYLWSIQPVLWCKSALRTTQCMLFYNFTYLAETHDHPPPPLPCHIINFLLALPFHCTHVANIQTWISVFLHLHRWGSMEKYATMMWQRVSST